MVALRNQIIAQATALASLGQSVTPTTLRRAIIATAGDAPHERTILRELLAMADDGLAERFGEGRGAVWMVRR